MNLINRIRYLSYRKLIGSSMNVFKRLIGAILALAVMGASFLRGVRPFRFFLLDPDAPTPRDCEWDDCGKEFPISLIILLESGLANQYPSNSQSWDRDALWYIDSGEKVPRAWEKLIVCYPYCYRIIIRWPVWSSEQWDSKRGIWRKIGVIVESSSFHLPSLT